MRRGRISLSFRELAVGSFVVLMLLTHTFTLFAQDVNLETMTGQGGISFPLFAFDNYMVTGEYTQSQVRADTLKAQPS
ncbi:MAG: hypothetical protein GY809_07170 [Planctomycetes bacterium]|nr:hypothetical protein [Planctomycetota bacterium]